MNAELEHAGLARDFVIVQNAPFIEAERYLSKHCRKGGRFREASGGGRLSDASRKNAGEQASQLNQHVNSAANKRAQFPLTAPAEGLAGA